MDNAHKLLHRAKLNFFVKQNVTFFVSLLANLRLVIDKKYPTAATDGIHLWINPDFIETLDLEETIGLLLHEVMHCVYQHMDRAIVGNLDHRIWNIAGDYFINLQIIALGFRLPEGALLDNVYQGMGTKEIYDILIQDPEQCDSLPMEDIILQDSEEGREQVITNIVKAATQAKINNDPGSIPNDIARMVDKLINPRLPWNVILQNHMSSYSKNDFRWAKPNKRFLPEFYLPSLHNESVNKIVAAIDVSGSVEQKDLDAFLAELKYIFDMLKPKILNILSFDVIIHEDIEFIEGDVLEGIKLHGGGGTYVGPIIDKVVEESPEITIIFTDGEFQMPYLGELTSDIFWIIKNHQDFTFEPSKGTVIRYE